MDPRRYLSTTVHDGIRWWRVIEQGVPMCKDTQSLEAALATYWKWAKVERIPDDVPVPVWDGEKGVFTHVGGILHEI